MKKKDLAKMLEHSNPKEIYIINDKNQVVLIKCPFKVRVLYEVGFFKKNTCAFVDEVKVTIDLVTVYIIKGNAYYYYHFDILI